MRERERVVEALGREGVDGRRLRDARPARERRRCSDARASDDDDVRRECESAHGPDSTLRTPEYSSICFVKSCGYEIVTSVIDPSAAGHRRQLRHHEAAVRRQVQLVDARHDLVAQLRIEMDAVGVEQLRRRRGIAFGLDALHFGEQLADAVAERLRIDHHQVRLAVARARFDRLGVGHQPAHDHLAVAHVVFLDLRAFADAAQLHQRVARVGLVLGARRCRRDRRRG